MNFHFYNEVLIVTVALLIVSGICLGLLIALAIFVSGQKREKEQKVNLLDTGSSLTKSPSHPRGEGKSYLTVSDWVNYLTSERSGIMGTVLNASALLVALVALIYSTSTNTPWSSIADGVVVIALTVYLLMKIFRPFERRGKLVERILKDVMSGELKSEDSIRKAWLEGLKSKKARPNIS